MIPGFAFDSCEGCHFLKGIRRRLKDYDVAGFRQHENVIAREEGLAVTITAALPLALAGSRVDAREDAFVEPVDVMVIEHGAIEAILQIPGLPDRTSGKAFGCRCDLQQYRTVVVTGGANPGGLPIEVFNQIPAGVLADRSQFFKDLSLPFYGFNRAGAKISEGLRDSFWMQGMLAGHKSALDCIKAFSETDFTKDLKKIDVPTLILHGDDDQIVPIGASALLSSKLVKGSTLKVYPGFSHGMCSVNKDQINLDLLAFIESK